MKIIKTINSSYPLLIRLMAGAVFLSEGIQKFLFPGELGVGRFIKIGIPFPAFSAPMVGIFEIVCGLFFILGLAVRPSAVILIIDMIVAIAATKIPLLINYGFWKMAHEARTDWCMLVASIFLLITGAGKFSFDHYFSRKSKV